MKQQVCGFVLQGTSSALDFRKFLRAPCGIQPLLNVSASHWNTGAQQRHLSLSTKSLLVTLGGQRGQCIPVSAVVAEGTWPGTVMSSSSWELIWLPPLFAFLNLAAVFCTPFPPTRIALCPASISLPQILCLRTIFSLSYFHYSNLS